MKKEKSKKDGQKKFKYIFSSILFAIVLGISIYLLSTVEPSSEKASANRYLIVEENPEFQTFDFIESELQLKEEQKQAELEQEAFQDKVNRVERIFEQYGGYMSGYGEILVRQAESCGGDYKLLTAIAGKESGFGRINYKIYNPFGYLNGVQYSSYEEALNTLSCEISSRVLAPCNNDVVCVINRYAGPDTDKERWINSINYFISII